MKKRKRYQMTEGQLKSVIKVIPENYPAGVTGYNIGLSGADRDVYDYISGVDYDKQTGDVVFTVESDQGQTFYKRIWSGDDKFINIMERELPKYDYDLQENPEWDIKNVTMNNRYIIFTISDYGAGEYTVPIHMDYFMDILPEMEGDEEQLYQNSEPDYDADVDNY
jgi:hypothetical protein